MDSTCKIGHKMLTTQERNTNRSHAPGLPVVGAPNAGTDHCSSSFVFFFFFNDPAPTEISPLPLHDALPIFLQPRHALADGRGRSAQHPPGRHETAGLGDLNEHHETVEAVQTPLLHCGHPVPRKPEIYPTFSLIAGFLSSEPCSFDPGNSHDDCPFCSAFSTCCAACSPVELAPVRPHPGRGPAGA